VPAPRGHAVEADDRRRALVAERANVEPAHAETSSDVRAVRPERYSGPRPPLGVPGPLESP
jgi:hypothetical protein